MSKLEQLQDNIAGWLLRIVALCGVAIAVAAALIIWKLALRM